MKRYTVFFFMILILLGCSKESVSNKEAPQSSEDIAICVLIYDSNGADSGTVPITRITLAPGDSIIISSNTGRLMKQGNVFVAWNTERDGSGTTFTPHENFVFTEDTVLYAQWLDIAKSASVNVSSDRVFFRALNTPEGRQYILVKEGDRFLLSPDYYEDVIDPNIIKKDAYRLIEDFSSRMLGFWQYPDHRYASDLIAAKAEGCYGFVDIANHFFWAIEPTYEDAHPFKEDYAAVKLNGKWGYINRKGEIVVKPRYDFVFDFFNGLSVVVVGEALYRDSNWGVIDREGNIIISPFEDNPYFRIYSYYEFSITKANEDAFRYVCLDRKGNVVIDYLLDCGDRGGPPDPFFRFRENGLAMMASADAPKGTWVNPQNRLHGAFSRSGIWIIPLQLGMDEVERLVSAYGLPDGASFPHRDHARGKWGYMDNKLSWMIEPQYDYATRFRDDVAIVEFEGKYGLINRVNEYVIEPAYKDLQYSKFGMFKVQVDDLWGLIDRQSEWILKPEYSRIFDIVDPTAPFLVEHKRVLKFVKSNGKVVIKLSEDQKAIPFKNGIAFIYTPIGEVIFGTSGPPYSVHQLYEVQGIDTQGNMLFKNEFIEYVEQFEM
jgi:hypothetical protein